MNDTLAKCVIEFTDGLSNCHHPEDKAVIERYLASLAPILAKATIGADVLHDLQQIERLFGNTWLKDDQPFKDALFSWRKFKTEYELLALKGMTAHERLSALHLLSDYDAAVLKGDKKLMKALLERVYLDIASIQQIVR